MYCYYCGNLLQEDELFCPKCGKEAKEIHINLDHLKFYEELITKKDCEINEAEATPEVKVVPENNVIPEKNIVAEVEIVNESSKEDIKVDETNNKKQNDNAKNNTQNKPAKKVVVRVKPKKK